MTLAYPDEISSLLTKSQHLYWHTSCYTPYVFAIIYTWHTICMAYIARINLLLTSYTKGIKMLQPVIAFMKYAEYVIIAIVIIASLLTVIKIWNH